MPRRDPVPSPRRSLVQRFWRIFRWLILFAAVVAAIAVVLVAYGAATDINLLIATAIGCFFTVLLGSALMTLTFLSSSSGHDEAVGGEFDEDEQ